MNRTDVLRDSLLAGPHPKYGVLSYGRWMRIRALCAKAAEDDTPTHNQIAWFVCTRPHTDIEVVRLLDAADPVFLIKDYCEDHLHVTEMAPFLDWFQAQLTATDAAITKPKEDTGPGKPDGEQPEANPIS